MNFSQKKCNKYRKLILPADSVSEKEESGLNDDSEISDDDEDMEESKSGVEEEAEEKENLHVSDLDDDSGDLEEKNIDYSFLQTDTLYHLYYPKHVFASLDTDTVAERLRAQLEGKCNAARGWCYHLLYIHNMLQLVSKVSPHYYIF